MTLPPTNDSPGAEPVAVVSSDSPAATTQSAEAPVTNNTSTTPAKRDVKRASLWWWLLGIACVLGAELYVYGHDGWVRVCVGLQGVTDLNLMDRPKASERMHGFPICAEQSNLGMYSRSDDAARDALEVACARGASLLHGDKQACLRKENRWIRRVDKASIPPWDERLYKRLLFLD